MFRQTFRNNGFRCPSCSAGISLLALAIVVSVGPGVATSQTQESPKAIALNDYEVEGVKVALLSVKRISDGSLTVKWEYRNTTSQPKNLGESFAGMGSSEAYSLNWHAYLTDSRNKVKYPVAKDERGTPVASKHAAGKVVVLAPGKTMGTWAKFINIPPDVKKISVFIPGADPFEDVDISE